MWGILGRRGKKNGERENGNQSGKTNPIMGKEGKGFGIVEFGKEEIPNLARNFALMRVHKKKKSTDLKTKEKNKNRKTFSRKGRNGKPPKALRGKRRFKGVTPVPS